MTRLYHGYGALPAGYGRVTYASGAVLNATQRAFAAKLDAMLPFDLHVTSGTRTAAAQARAIAYKRQREGDAAVRALYAQKDLVAEVLSCDASDVACMTRVLEGQMHRGRFLSRHMRGDAIDLRTRDKTASQVQAMYAAARKLGANPVKESDHLHVGRIGSTVEKVVAALTSQDATTAVAYTARRVPWWAWIGGAGGVLVLAAAIRRRRRRIEAA